MRPGIRDLIIETVPTALCERYLKGVVTRIRASLHLVNKKGRVGSQCAKRRGETDDGSTGTLWGAARNRAFTSIISNPTEGINGGYLGVARLVDITEIEEFASDRSYIPYLEHRFASQLLLDVQIVIVNVGST